MSRGFFDTVLNFIFPPSCVACSVAIQDHGAFCGACFSEIVKIPESDSCLRCDNPLSKSERNLETKICTKCALNPPSFDRLFSCFLYYGSISRIIISLKYYHNLSIVKFITFNFISQYSDILHTHDIITPVPMHWLRLSLRTFNQSALISAEICKTLNQTREAENKIMLIQNLLKRKFARRQVSTLNMVQRLKNVRDSFSFNSKFKELVQGKSIAIIDDVATTGATVNECAKILKRYGAKNVNIFCLARTGGRSSYYKR